ncbi:MAG: hypothetical protein ABIH23_05210 [bacterium]
MLHTAISLLILAGLPGATEEKPRTFRIMVAPMPVCATPAAFPPRGEEVMRIWHTRNFDKAARIEWYEKTSLPWPQIARNVSLSPDAALGEYQFLLATLGSKNYAPYLSWVSPVVPAATCACLLTLKETGVQRIVDLKDNIVGVINVAYPLVGGEQHGLFLGAGLEPGEIHVRALGTAQEVVHHLFAGTIDAAALPEGSAEEALRLFGQEDAIPELRVIKRFPYSGRYALFVRRELLKPIPLFPGLLADVLRELSPPESMIQESVLEGSLFQPSLGSEENQ